MLLQLPRNANVFSSFLHDVVGKVTYSGSYGLAGVDQSRLSQFSFHPIGMNQLWTHPLVKGSGSTCKKEDCL